MNIGRTYITIIVALCTVLTGCTKRYPAPALERFSFHGTVKTCVTNHPVDHLHLTVKGTIPGSGGMFGTPAKSVDLGTAITDKDGNFKVTPQKIDGVTSFVIFPDTDNVNISKMSDITRDSILISGNTDFDLSFSLSEYGYVRVNYTDVYYADTSDMLSIYTTSANTQCGWGISPLWESASPLPTTENLALFKGNIQHGTLLYKMVGNADCSIFYQKGSKHFTDTLHYTTVFCKPNDTVYYNFNY